MSSRSRRQERRAAAKKLPPAKIKGKIKGYAVYALRDTRNNEDFYYGETTEATAAQRLKKHVSQKTISAHEGDRKIRRVAEIQNAGFQPEMRILSSHPTREAARAVERQIKQDHVKRGKPLTNQAGQKPLLATQLKVGFGRLIDGLF